MGGWVGGCIRVSAKRREQSTISWPAEDGDINFHGLPVSQSPAEPETVSAAPDLT